LSFFFIFPYFHYFTANVTRALPLEAIKGEAGARAINAIAIEIGGKKRTRQQQLERTTLETTTTTTQETWDLLPLSKDSNPYYEHHNARQHEQQ
jgi:hypothetical protein